MACRGVFAVSLGAGRGQTGIACRMLCMVSRTQPWCGVRSRPLNGAAAVLGGDRGKSIHSMPSPPSTPLATGWIRAWLAPRALTDRGGGGSALGANQGGECALLGSVPDPLTKHASSAIVGGRAVLGSGRGGSGSGGGGSSRAAAVAATAANQRGGLFRWT